MTTIRCIRRLLACSVLALAIPASAQIFIAPGGPIEIQYNEGGLWNWRTATQGFLMRIGGTQRDVSYPGTPWQQVSIRFTDSCDGTDYFYQGNESFGAQNWQNIVPPTVMNLNPGRVGSFVKWTAFPLEVSKTETWDDTGQIVQIVFEATNIGCCELQEVALMHAVDPDQDRQLPAPAGTFNTINDTIGVLSPQDLVYSIGPSSQWTVAYGQCDPSQILGHTNWQTNPYAAITDYNGLNADDTMHAAQFLPNIAPGQTVRVTFLFIVGRDTTDVINQYTLNRDDLCDCVRDSPYPYKPISSGFDPIALDHDHVLTYATAKRGKGTLVDAIIEQTIDGKRPYLPALSAEAAASANPANTDPVGEWSETVRYYNADPTELPAAYGGGGDK